MGRDACTGKLLICYGTKGNLRISINGVAGGLVTRCVHTGQTNAFYTTKRSSSITYRLEFVMEYLIGQRVILNDKEIGTVVIPERLALTPFGVWVFSPSKGYASDYALTSVKPLPGGQV